MYEKWYIHSLMLLNMFLEQTRVFVRLLIMKESTLWHIASQAVKRKTCHCVACTRIVTSLHVWSSTSHWGVKRVIVKAKRPRPTHHCLQMHVWAKRTDKRQLLFVFSASEFEEELGARTRKKATKKQTNSGYDFQGMRLSV